MCLHALAAMGSEHAAYVCCGQLLMLAPPTLPLRSPLQRLHNELAAEAEELEQCAPRLRRAAEAAAVRWAALQQQDACCNHDDSTDITPAATAAPAATTAEPASATAAATASSSVRGSPLPAATPVSTPVGSFPAPNPLLAHGPCHHPPPPPIAVDVARCAADAAAAEGRLVEAEAMYREALLLHGDSVPLLLGYAALCLARGDGARAVRCCDEVLALQQSLSEEEVAEAAHR